MIETVQQHMLQEQKRFPGASGEFSWLLSGITLATKMIESRVRRAGLGDILGDAGEMNVQGEVQQKLDVFANEALMHCLSARASIGVLASEENEKPRILAHHSKDANYCVVFDPLDGSSNIDVNISVGTTFAVLRRPPGAAWLPADCRRLRRLRILHDPGLQRRQRRPRVHARPVRRRVPAEPPEYPCAAAGEILLGE
jgi:fructose-1,6-bisphosphatase I